MKIPIVTASKYTNIIVNKVETLINPKPQITGLLPYSMKKAPSTGLTTRELIYLILKNL